MILSIKNFDQLDERSMLDIYAEGIEENAADLYPDEDAAAAIKKEEAGFIAFFNDFLAKPENEYFVLEEEGNWVSALRLTLVKEGLYYLEALETRPDRRKMGCAKRLLLGVIGELKKRGPFELYDCVSKRNEPSLRTHSSCGFEIASETGYCYLNDTENERTYSMRYAYRG